MTDDGRLLRDYVQRGSQAAFSALVSRHLNFVYSVSLREAGDAAIAEDVTQVVFLILARKAPALRPEPSLTGWLFQTARFAAKNARRRDAHRREWEARALTETPASCGTDAALWDQVRPTLNEALASLGAQDREAVLLRFADGLSFPELGMAFGTSEDAARMRLNRAVERLRRFFAKEGVTLSALVLAGLLTDHAVQAAPDTCVSAVVQIAETIAAGGSGGVISTQIHSELQGVLKAMTVSKLKLAATLSGIALLAGSLPFVTRAQNPSENPLPPVSAMTGRAGSPQPLDAFILPGAKSGGGGTTDKMKITTYGSPRSYEEVCQFYAATFLSRDFSKVGALGVEGINGKESGYAQRQGRGIQAATFYQSLPAYTISAFVSHGMGETTTQVTLVYETK